MLRYANSKIIHWLVFLRRTTWQRFTETCFDQETLMTMKSVKEVKIMMDHRPLHPESEEYHRFLHQILLKIETLSEKYPYFDFDKEKESCLTRLNRLH